MRIFGYFKKCYYLCTHLIGRLKSHLTFLTFSQLQASVLGIEKVQISFDLPHTRPIASKLAWFSFNRKVGRVIDRAGLEIRYTPFGYRGFESLTFRQKESHNTVRLFYYPST